MTILRRSVASTNAIQKCLPTNKHGIISTNFEAHLVRFRPVSISRYLMSISRYLTCYLATHSCR